MFKVFEKPTHKVYCENMDGWISRL